MSEVHDHLTPFLIDGLSVEMLADALREYGCCARIEECGEKHPRIVSGVQGLKFVVHPLGDPVGEEFGCWRFVLARGRRPCTLDAANEFNRTYAFGKFFVDEEGDPNLEWLWHFGGGVSPTYLPQVFEHWQAAVASFVDHLRRSAE